MKDEFIIWVTDILLNIIYSISDAIDNAFSFLVKVVKWSLIIITLPIWIVPFLYWYFTEYKKTAYRKGGIEDEKSN